MEKMIEYLEDRVKTLETQAKARGMSLDWTININCKLTECITNLEKAKEIAGISTENEQKIQMGVEYIKKSKDRFSEQTVELVDEEKA
jgi:hypothetical protein